MSTGSEDRVYLDFSGEGRGFDLSSALFRSLDPEHFGPHGIQERERAVRGECEILLIIACLSSSILRHMGVLDNRQFGLFVNK